MRGGEEERRKSENVAYLSTEEETKRHRGKGSMGAHI